MKKLPMPKVLLGLAICAGTAALALGILSLPWRGSRPAEPVRTVSAVRGKGALKAGAGAAEIALPQGVPIAGFPRLARSDWASTGVRDPVGARALFLEVPGARVAIVSVELLLVTEPIVRDVERRVADLGLDALLVGATHTHAGPGGFWDDLVVEQAGLGPYDPAAAGRVAEAITGALRKAVATAAPATLAVAKGTEEKLVRARSRGQVDGRMLSLRVADGAGRPLAELLVFAAHPTTLGQRNRLISGDWPGRLAAFPGHGARLVLQGAIGDQSARIGGPRPTRPERYAEVVERADEGLASSAPAAEVAISAASVAVTLPAPELGAVPALLRRASTTLVWNRLPASARVTALRLGPLLLLAVPAEPIAEVATRWRQAAGDGAEIVSLTGGYVGYVDTPSRTRSGAGEAARTYYGPELAERLQAAMVEAARAAQ